MASALGAFGFDRASSQRSSLLARLRSRTPAGLKILNDACVALRFVGGGDGLNDLSVASIFGRLRSGRSVAWDTARAG